jgi:DNA-binding NtrC family response regulator
MSILPNVTDRPTTILHIDDEHPSLIARTALLESEGYRVFPALNASAAVELFVAHQIDVVLSTMVFPGPSGADLSVFMRQVRPEVSVVLLSRTVSLPATLLKQVDGCVETDASMRELLICLRHVVATRSAGAIRSAQLLRET